MKLTNIQYEDLIRIDKLGFFGEKPKDIDRKYEIAKELNLTHIDPLTIDRIKAAGKGGEFTPPSEKEIKKDKEKSIALLNLSLAMTNPSGFQDRNRRKY